MLRVCMRLFEICRCKTALDTSNDYVGKERYTVGNSNEAVNSIKILLKIKVDSSGDNNRICSCLLHTDVAVALSSFSYDNVCDR